MKYSVRTIVVTWMALCGIALASAGTARATVADSTDVPTAPSLEEIFNSARSDLLRLHAAFTDRLDWDNVAVVNGLFADLLHVVQEYREGNERTALMEFGALRDEITRLIQIIQAGRPPADGSFVPPWGTVPPDSGYLPPIMPPAPFIPDSAELIERLGELDAAIDSARAELPTDVPVVVDLLDHADALADSARALLTAGQPFVAALRLAEAHGAIWRARYAATLADELPAQIAAARDTATGIGFMLASDPIPEAEASLDAAFDMLDTASVALTDGRVFAAERALREAQGHLFLVRGMLWERENLSERLEYARHLVDSLGDVLAGLGMATIHIENADASADSAETSLEDGLLTAARRLLDRVLVSVNAVSQLINDHERITGQLERSGNVLDSLANVLLANPVVGGDEHLTRARALVDSTVQRLAVGDVAGANRSLTALFEQLERVNYLLGVQDMLTTSLPILQEQLDNIEPYLVSSPSERAGELFVEASAAADSAETFLAAGNPERALVLFDRSRARANQAIYLLTVRNHTIEEIHALHNRTVALLEDLPADAYRERGITVRAAELADSAATLLLAGNIADAQKVAERTNRALALLIPADGSEPGTLPGIIDSTASVADMVQSMQYIIGQAWQLLEDSQADSAMHNTMLQVSSLAQQIAFAMSSGDDELARALILQGVQIAVQIVADLRNDTDLTTMFFDAQTADLIAAGQRALQDAQNPTDVAQPALPTEYALSNAPNPFNPSTSVTFALPEGGQTRLAIYNMLGQEVNVLVDEFLPAGTHTVRWNGRSARGGNMSSGIYFARLQNQTTSMVIRMVLAR